MLVHRVLESLLGHEHVALIGPCGIGKSALAKDVLNDNAIVKKTIIIAISSGMKIWTEIVSDAFIGHIAETLGLEAPRTSYHGAILEFLSKTRVLLVPDNGETFLDAAQDKGRRVDAIDEFGSRICYNNVDHEKQSTSTEPDLGLDFIPTLEKSSARKAFTTIAPTSPLPPLASYYSFSIFIHCPLICLNG